MMDDRSRSRSVDWKNMAHISQDLKLTAQDFDIPVVGVTQATRAADKSKGEDLTELAYADAFGQDADAVFRVSKKDVIDENNQKRTELYLTAPGLREGKFDGIIVRGEPATSFDYIKTIIDMEAEDDGKHESAYGSKGSSSPFKKGDVGPKIPLKTLKTVK
jgi:replicative DNA helicase